MSKRRIIIVSVGLIVLLGFSFVLMQVLVGMKPEPPRKAEEVVKRFVKAKPVAYHTVTASVKAPGRVLATKEVMLVAEASGRIEPGEVALKKGARFRKGQKLLNIYKDEAEMALRSRKSQFLNSLANMLPDIKIDYPDFYDQFQQFFSSVRLDRDLPNLPTVAIGNNEQLKVFLASRNILSDYYSIKKDEMALKRYTLYAPFDGTFTQVNFEVGAFVNMGTQLAKMISTNNLEVEVPVENRQSEWIKVGSPAIIHSTSRNKNWQGHVVRKADFVASSTQSRSIFVKVDPDNARDVLSGEYLDVEFKGQEIPDAMEIQRSAVFNSNIVFTVVDGRLKKEPINLIKYNEETIVFNGLEPGTELVVEPLINAKEKTEVEIIR
ncbi:efflux RND transporter periplasmic adaptor subunit [Prolixibacter denitrificans]|uniref:Multidrug efflux pump subunit AcrA (Membrane-fusion protein) n=2 Tax=Prolixibacter denitrificans TaxID=1541063 RepID=A0A2P8CII5_9BACT|nr:efflux RND transporter periplasmic adaptor subunit [Prolixibacter denitrificans]PSK84786.1 multidrug efflux pump subunit AcrA (membrane-fusion protein) [Prolixibacter denitrificans]